MIKITLRVLNYKGGKKTKAEKINIIIPEAQS